MVDYYISWCPDIHNDKEALEHIKNSKIIKGVEGIFPDECFITFNNLGLNYSLHNPRFKEYKNIEEVGFIEGYEKNKLLKQGLSNSNPSVMGFHPPRNKQEYENFTKNIRFLKSKTNKQILIEPRPFWIESNILKNSISKDIQEDMLNYLLNDFTKEISTVEFLDKYTKDNEIGILLDIAHTSILIDTLIESKIISETKEEYFLRYVKTLGSRIKQIHINEIGEIENTLIDAHAEIKENSESLKILELIYPYLKNLELITLEVKTNKNPLDHVIELEKEIKIIQEALLTNKILN